jgi:hypothetical protein
MLILIFGFFEIMQQSMAKTWGKRIEGRQKSEGVGGRKETIDLCLISSSHLSIFKVFAYEYEPSLRARYRSKKGNERASGRPAPTAPSSEETATAVLA